MAGQQDGPVEQGAAPVVHMDLDLAVRWFYGMAVDHPGGGRADLEMAGQARAALQVLVDRARQYVAGPTSGRLAALCQVLQEPVPQQPEPVNIETVVQAYLTERDQVMISRKLARSLGLDVPGVVH